MEIIVNTWADLKFLAANRSPLLLDFYEDFLFYKVWLTDNPVIFSFVIWKNGYEPLGTNVTQIAADRNDFETNYKQRLINSPNTFSAAITGLVPAASATDIFEIDGSQLRIIEILKVRFSGFATTAAGIDVQLIKRSTLNSGGTFTNPTIVPYITSVPNQYKFTYFPTSPNTIAAAPIDGIAVAPIIATVQNIAYAALKSYTANPTLGNSAGLMLAMKYQMLSATTFHDPLLFDFTYSPITLTGPQESLSVNLNGVSLTGGSIDITIEWREI